MTPPPPSNPDSPEHGNDVPTVITEMENNLRSSMTRSAMARTRGSGVRSADLLKDNDGWLDGKFRLLEKLGEGGFGLVFKAEQVYPIQRLVAVKILKAGMDSQQVIARFETERQSLALMEHPNISRVLDAGETERGQSYFVMELVRGRSITTYCSKKELTLNQRLELFIPVCQAVNHAHQKGIIHRDLKPSNVMVMEENGQPIPKVIDFGIAKVLEQKDASQTLATGMDQLVGTPGYISPEQIEHGSSHVDTRSDVYALGSILMELLTGKALVTPMDVAQKPLHQILRDQVERDPPKPSSREPSLKGDLDWIVLKALERDPARRYGSTDELANDLRRYLHHEPVRACPPSRSYVIKKFVRRHQVGVAASVAIALAVLSGGITSTALYFEAEKNRKAAEEAGANLKKEYSRSDEVMARQFTERRDYTESVAWLTRSLRTDPGNTLAATNLLSLLQHSHLLHPTTPELLLPSGSKEAHLVALSQQAGRAVAVSTVESPGKQRARRTVLSIWDTTTHQRTDHPLPKGVIATCLRITRDGQHAILAMDNGQVELWSLTDGKRQPLSPKLPQPVLSMALSGDGHTLAVGGENGTVHVWDTGRLERPALVLKDAELPVNLIELDYFGTLVATGQSVESQETKGRALVWDLSTAKPVGEAFETRDGISSLALHREREMIAVGLYSGTVHVGNFRTETELLTPLGHPSAVICMSMNANATTLMVGDGRGYLHAWDLTKGQPRIPAQALDGEILTAAQALEQGLVTSVSRHGEMQVWNTLTGERVQHRLRHSIAEVSVTPDGSMLIVAPRNDPSVQVWSTHQRMTTRRYLAGSQESFLELPTVPEDAPANIHSAQIKGWNRAGSLLATADPEGKVSVYDLKAGFQPLGPAFVHPPAVGAVTISDDGKLAVTSGRDQEVRLWNVSSGRPTGISIRHEAFVSSLALSPDACHLVTVTDAGEIRVWDAQTGDCLTPRLGQGSGLTEIHVSADGKTMIYRMEDQGWFSLPMPEIPSILPPWFLDLAEALAHRRLSEDGKSQTLSLAEVRSALSQIPKTKLQDHPTAIRWAHWLLSDPNSRALSPQEDELFGEYVSSLAKRKDPGAQAEALRYRTLSAGE
ncbi:serine/threonine-protein kinase [Prosthecobacter sp. SYSU 5D2]|uniref:serine/threonine-protein kinase n=1 Tax=Prosthecobacter sp. SYSU 5D2 TaxID=3134134 RepID=UPI0031FEA66E